MIQRRYEISNGQWEQFKDMFSPYQTGRLSKLINHTMFLHPFKPINTVLGLKKR